ASSISTISLLISIRRWRALRDELEKFIIGHGLGRILMSLLIEGGRIPPRWAERKSSPPVVSIGDYNRQEESVKIAFINNMPDPALEDTEMQFFELLNAVAGDIPVGDKQFGAFATRRVADHALASHTGDLLRFPHSRWNEVREDALGSCGYVVLA